MSRFANTFTAAGQASGILSIPPGERASFELAVASTEEFIGRVVVEKTSDGGQTFEIIHEFVGTVDAPIEDDAEISGEILNAAKHPIGVRVRCAEFFVDPDADPDPIASDEISYILEELVDPIVEPVFKRGEIRNRDGVLLMRVTESGVEIPSLTTAASPSDLSSAESVATNGSAPTPVSLDVYQTLVTTGGSEGDEDLALGDGTGAIIGQRKLIVLQTQTEAADVVVLDHANFSQGSDSIDGIELDAEGEFVLAEWRGSSWEVIAASAGVVTTS